jgi:hypothetical protein
MSGGPPTLYKPQQQNTDSNKILDSSTFDFSQTTIIKPPFEEKSTSNTKYTRLVIDSRDRDRTLYPNPNKYVIKLETDVLEVTSGEIIIKEIPLPMYLINEYNHLFTITRDSTSANYLLPQGNYTPLTMQDTLGIVLGPNFNVTYNSVIDKLSITLNAGGNFTLKFANPDLALILGFNVSNVSSDGSLVAPYRINFTANPYAVLRIGQFTINNSINPVLHKSTALISGNDVRAIRTTHPIKKYFNPPIARLVKLDISFTDYYGFPYDFQNQDHRLEIMLESKKALTKYTSFV